MRALLKLPIIGLFMFLLGLESLADSSKSRFIFHDFDLTIQRTQTYSKTLMNIKCFKGKKVCKVMRQIDSKKFQEKQIKDFFVAGSFNNLLKKVKWHEKQKKCKQFVVLYSLKINQEQKRVCLDENKTALFNILEIESVLNRELF